MFLYAAVWALLAHVVDTLTVGFPVSLSGPFATEGLGMANASTLFAFIASASGVDIDIIVVDDRSTASGVHDATITLLESGVNVFLGPFSSDLTSVERDITEAAVTPILLMAAGAVDTEIFQSSTGAFGVLLPGSTLLTQPLQVLRAAGAATVLLASEPLLGLQSICSVNTSTFGLQPVLSKVFTVQANNTDELLDMIHRLQPDVVVLCTFFDATSQLLTAAASRGINAHAWVTVFGLGDPRVSAYVVPASSFSFLFDSSSWAPVAEIPGAPLPIDSTCLEYAPYGCISPAQFQNAFVEAFATEPTQHAAGTFAALDVIVQSMMAAGTADPAALIDQVSQLRFCTAFGILEFGAHSHQNVGVGYVRQIQSGGIQVLAPYSAATAEIVYPVPTWQQQECIRNGGCGTHGRCAPAGGCACNFGFSGESCSTPSGIVLLCVGCSVAGLLLCGVFGYLCHSRRRAKRATRRAQAATEEASRRSLAASEEAARTAHARTLAYASHELANPLFQVTAAVEEQEAGELTTAAAVSVIKGAAQRMTRVLQDIALMAPVGMAASCDPTAVELIHIPVRLQFFLRDLCHRLRHLHGVVCHAQQDESAPTNIVSDPVRLSQLLASTIVILQASAQVPCSVELSVSATPLTSLPPGARAAGPSLTLRLHDTAAESSPFFCVGNVITNRQPVVNQHPTQFLIFTATLLSVPVAEPGVTHAVSLMEEDDTAVPAPFAWVMDLTTCCAIAEMLGGTLDMQMQELPPSCTVTVSVAECTESPGYGRERSSRGEQVDVDASPGPSRPPTGDTVISVGGGMTGARPLALVVDDEQVVRMLVSRMLRRQGWDADVVTDGVDIPMLQVPAPGQAKDYTLVLLDIVMPRSNGVDIAKLLRARGYTGTLVAMTANTSATDLQNYQAAGFDGVLGKPFDVNNLKNVIALALRA